MENGEVGMSACAHSPDKLREQDGIDEVRFHAFELHGMT